MRERDRQLIWKHTHRDFRSVIGGVRYVLVLREGGTHLVPLGDLNDAECALKLAYAEAREARAKGGQS